MDITLATPALIDAMAEALRQENGAAEWFLDCTATASGEGGMTLIAHEGEAVLGYASLAFTASYPPFAAADIPEITSITVLSVARRRGIGRALLCALEEAATQAGYDRIGLGVGVTTDYQQAMTLYVREGYVPDGRGLYHYALSDRPVTYGDTITIDTSTSLWFVKSLV